MKTDNEKIEFIKDYIKKRLSVDILDADFVDAFIEKFNAPHRITIFGANKCPSLGKLLAEMSKNKILKRFPCGLSKPNWQPGFPKWVYSYQLFNTQSIKGENEKN